MEPDRLTRELYLPVVVTLGWASLRSAARSWTIRIATAAVLVGVVALHVAPGTSWAGTLAWLPILFMVAVPVGASFWIPVWNSIRPDRRAWVGAAGRSFVTAKMRPPMLYPDNASARREGVGEAAALLDQVMAFADEGQLTAEFTASNAKVEQVYADRYGAFRTGTSWGRPRMRRLPGGRRP